MTHQCCYFLPGSCLSYHSWSQQSYSSGWRNQFLRVLILCSEFPSEHKESWLLLGHSLLLTTWCWHFLLSLTKIYEKRWIVWFLLMCCPCLLYVQCTALCLYCMVCCTISMWSLVSVHAAKSCASLLVPHNTQCVEIWSDHNWLQNGNYIVRCACVHV